MLKYQSQIFLYASHKIKKKVYSAGGTKGNSCHVSYLLCQKQRVKRERAESAQMGEYQPGLLKNAPVATFLHIMLT